MYRPIIERIEGIHKEVLRGRVFVALHMHAGDGNVYTNIPVNSDNYAMLQTATRRRTHHALQPALDGVVSSEHGIGMTNSIPGRDNPALPRVPKRIDPNSHFSKGAS